MKIEFLGTAGAFTTPQAGCFCDVCEEARAKGVPYSRTGPGVYIHDLSLLIDTSEQINFQLNRAQIAHVASAFYSHWHPDHTAGRRIWEMNIDWRHWPSQSNPTDIYVPYQVAQDFKRFLGLEENLAYMERMGAVNMHPLAEGETVTLGNYLVTPFPVAETYVYAFLFEGEGKRILIAPDELVGWQPPDFVHGVDLVILPMGILEFDPFSGERRIPLEHPVLKTEATFRQTLQMLKQMQPKQAIMTHIEEPDGLGYDDYVRLEARMQQEGWALRFAYDTMVVDA
ncbi:MAG: hypothetical protein CSA11_00085 [Chloroflexi bacterium]|nr:MAG: hypothetical protein CSA11_00085 [Chloroflexota bacterium]